MDILYIYSYAKLFSEHDSGIEVATDIEEQDREKSKWKCQINCTAQLA